MTCPGCGKWSRFEGKRCHDCQKAYQKAYQKTDKRKAYQKAYQKTDKYKAYRKVYYLRKKSIKDMEGVG
jgi:hypothetical protein